jgi:hypothetical protein
MLCSLDNPLANIERILRSCKDTGPSLIGMKDAELVRGFDHTHLCNLISKSIYYLLHVTYTITRDNFDSTTNICRRRRLLQAFKNVNYRILNV